MVLPYLRRALFALAMVLGASGALFAGTPSTNDVDPHAFQLASAAAPSGWAQEQPSFQQGVTDVDTDGDLDVPGEGISASVVAPPHDDAHALATLSVRPYRIPCGFPSISRAPPAAPIL